MTAYELLMFIATGLLFGAVWKYARRMLKWVLLVCLVLLARPLTIVCAAQGVDLCAAVEDIFEDAHDAVWQLEETVSDTALEVRETLDTEIGGPAEIPVSNLRSHPLSGVSGLISGSDQSGSEQK